MLAAMRSLAQPFLVAALLLLLLLGCGAELAPASVDAGEGSDGASFGLEDGSLEGGTLEGGSPEDASLEGGAGALEGFGQIAGPCAQLPPQLDLMTPSFFLNRLDFGLDAFDDPAERSLLSAGAQQILQEGTLGGSSVVSEAFAFEILARCEGASLLKTETQIVYDAAGKRTDILVEIVGTPVGVSVTRAVGFPRDAPYTSAEAAFIEGKLLDILESSALVSAADRWAKQILLVVAYAEMHADSVRAVWERLEPSVRADTIVYLVITDGADAPLY